MPRTVTSIAIFLVSPADVEPERKLFCQLVEEWNERHGREKGVMFEVLRWEVVAAGFGEDGQSVINTAISDRYDILAAIFWKRLGTPTERARSGSVEEYERALSRYKADASVNIAFLFKDTPIDFRREDLSQLQAVQSFEREVQSAGAFSKSFKDDKSFTFEVNLLLDKSARDLAASVTAGQVIILGGAAEDYAELALPNPSSSSLGTDDDLVRDELGLLDVVESLASHAEEGSKFLVTMSSSISALNEKLDFANAEINEIKKIRGLDPADVKPILASISTNMDEYSEFLEGSISEYSENTSAMIEDMRNLIDISHDFVGMNNNSEIEDAEIFRGTILNLKAQMSESRASFSHMNQVVASFQRLTSSFNKTRRRFVANTDALIAIMDTDIAVIDSALLEIDDLITKMKSGN